MSASLAEAPDLATLFSAARAVPLADVVAEAGTVLRRAGHRLVGPCPMCGGDQASTRFTIDPRRRVWSCFACPADSGQRAAGGGVIELVRRLERCDALTAACRLLDLDPAATRAAMAARRDGDRWPASRRRMSDDAVSGAADPAGRALPAPLVGRGGGQDAAPPGGQDAAPPGGQDWKSDRWLQAWATARPADSAAPPARWLAARGIDPAWSAAVLARLRWSDAFPFAWDADGRRWIDRPALLAPMVVLATGTTAPAALSPPRLVLTGVHATYVDAAALATARAARKMWGRASGAVTPLTRLADPGLPLVVGEGLESTLSAAALLGHAPGQCRLVATLTLGTLQGGWLADPRGLALNAVVADLARPAWTMREADGRSVARVIVVVDADMAPVKALVRAPAGGPPVERLLGAGERAALCAALVQAGWRRAGARSIRLLRPALGLDANDAAREAR